MKIRNKVILVYDIEVFQNIFHCAIKDTETGKITLFEISNRKNQLQELVEFFKEFENVEGSWNNSYTTDYQFNTNKIFAGYNNIHYDNPIINYIIDYYNVMKDKTYIEICKSIFNLSKTILNSKEGEEGIWKKWKYQQWFESFDLLTMLYSTQLRVGLKEMQVTMQYPNVQEFVYDWDIPLVESKFDEMIQYNINDVESTSELLDRCKKDIELRIAIEDEYGVRVLSKDGVNIGMKIITQKYLEKTGQTWWDIKDLRSPMDKIPLKDVILPFVKYDSPILKDMLDTLKKQTVSPGRKGYEYKFIFNNLRYTIGVGGIHSVNDPEIIIPKEDEYLIDCDVASLYPSMLIQHKFYPKHLGPEFLEIYSKIREERLEAKHNGDKVKNETLKFALNGLSGNLQNEHNFCYSPFTVMQIRMNGQLMLLMLAEKLTQIGCKILQANTDGLFILRRLSDEQKFKEVCKEWESLTKLVLEEDQFEAFYQYAINDYLAIKKGYKETHNPKLLKKKGLFIDEVRLGKGMNAMIIPEAINKCLADGINITDTINNCKDLNKFITYQKVSKTFSVEYASKLITRINRYYVSVAGHALLKCKVAEDGTRTNYISLLSGYGVTIVNNFDKIKEFPQDINYSYYITEASKITSVFQHKQLKLF